MTEEYWTGSADFAQSYGNGHSLTTEERRMLTLRNLAMSKAAKRKRKKQRAAAGEKRMTEAERREREQARIREERQTRGALSEENRRMAAFSAAAANPEPEPPAPPRQALPEPPMPIRPEPPELKGPDIDIALPEEPKAPEQKNSKSKRNQNTKRKQSSRSAAAGRFGASASAAGRNRITTGGSVMLGILTGVLIGTVIYGRVQTNEIYTQIAELQVKYDDLTARNVSMKSEMEAKMTVKNIEEYAEKELGLLPLNQSQIEYIQIQTEDDVTISEPEDNFFVTVNDYLVSIWEFLRGR